MTMRGNSYSAPSAPPPPSKSSLWSPTTLRLATISPPSVISSLPVSYTFSHPPSAAYAPISSPFPPPTSSPSSTTRPAFQLSSPSVSIVGLYRETMVERRSGL
ncbi:hypothetical protein BCR35DRAFT_304500 [Leucosporidium creatinivorum]|uniref:Uncharacterized protein n=1 Tax=Leucosporidium creatinivorum TaxID=106004 RepID=A0A1Y2F8Q8_9BASI|nr:hypothetical protein BCR35DRAFT_304500 [Leucosporidium creatinivorum]